MLSSCTELVHALPGRWRYRLRSGTPIQWDRLEQELQQSLPADQWRWRLNRRTSSLLLESLSDTDDNPNRSQQQGWQGLVAALERSGATTPTPKVVQVNVKVMRRRRSWLQAPANLISFLAASGLLSLAALLVLAGIVGLMLPLAPGIPLLLLAFVLVDTAFAIRRPFTGAAAI